MKNRNIITTKEVFYSLMDRKTGPIPISELIKEMAKITNQTVAAVEWTTFKSTKWFCQDWFLKNFDTTKSGRNRSVFWKKNTGIEKIEKIINYDSNERETVRYFTLGDVLRIENPVVAINCSSDGYDAQLLLELNPKTTIHNIEVKKKVLKEYEKKGYKTINHKMSVEKFFHINNIHFDIIWIDCYCYVCKPLWNTLRDINIKKSTEYLFVTLKSTKGMRMKDYFSSAMKIKFKDSKELQKDIIDDVLSNYVYVDSYKGPSSLKGSNQKMTFLKYVRNTGNKNKNTKHSFGEKEREKCWEQSYSLY